MTCCQFNHKTTKSLVFQAAVDFTFSLSNNWAACSFPWNDSCLCKLKSRKASFMLEQLEYIRYLSLSIKCIAIRQQIICQCTLLTVLLPGYEPYSRWPPWAYVWSKSSFGGEGGLKELLTKPPWNQTFLSTQTSRLKAGARVVTAELAVLSGLLLVLVEIKWVSWQPVKNSSVEVERNTYAKACLPPQAIISITVFVSVRSLSFICYSHISKQVEVQVEYFVAVCHNIVLISRDIYTSINAPPEASTQHAVSLPLTVNPPVLCEPVEGSLFEILMFCRKDKAEGRRAGSRAEGG